MYKYIIKTMENVDWMGVTPLVIFFTIFIMVILVWMTRSKTEIAELAKIPLEDGAK
jgi:ABC-type uncharacterized transport system permease subunit